MIETSTEDTKIQFQEECKMMNMIALPYIGVYGGNYLFAAPINILRSSTMPSDTPENIRSMVEDFTSQYKVEPDYFMITLDGGNLFEKFNPRNEHLRVNMVPHPYIFYNVHDISKDHCTHIFACIVADDNTVKRNLLCPCNENDALKFNTKQIVSHENRRSIFLHRSNDNYPAISPNNCAFRINLNARLLCFYLLVAGTYHDSIVKCFVGKYYISINGSETLALSPIMQSLSIDYSSQNVHKFITNLNYNRKIYTCIVTTLFGYFCNLMSTLTEIPKLKDLLRKLFSYCFWKNPSFDYENFKDAAAVNENEMKNIAEFYCKDIYNFIYLNLNCTGIEGLGESFLFSCYNILPSHPLSQESNGMIMMNNTNDYSIGNYFSEIVQKYLRDHLLFFDNMISSYLVFVNGKFNLVEDDVFDNHVEEEEQGVLLGDFVNQIPNEMRVDNGVEEIIKLSKEFYQQYHKIANPSLKIFREMIECDMVRF